MLFKVLYGGHRVNTGRYRACTESEAWGFLCGAMALQPDIEYDETQSETSIGTPLPDEEAHRTLLRESLTDEARFVVELLLDTPAEAIEFLYSPVQSRLRKWGLYSYLRKVTGWRAPTVRRVFAELEEYVEVL